MMESAATRYTLPLRYNDEMDILFLGDSLIEYYDWQERFPEHRVANLGIAGEQVEGLLSRIMKIQAHYIHADMIFIMTGINNLAMGDTGFVDFYKIIIEKLTSAYPKAKIYVHSLLPAIVDFISDKSILEANRLIKQIVLDKGVEYIDANSLFMDECGRPKKDYLLDDGVHISNKGYNAWAQRIGEIINTR